ncbi:hypothetical protein CLV98_104432 [Dyadobacter jejuensis]|uniref:Uncharacterized protein n=1 Tax=Dyadobacter jejuensis TaxID=1082580 RepID=A0A316AM17_9BACT|nr:hypothetical protein CLV98_104432 [Dyadobacter jejuensis]
MNLGNMVMKKGGDWYQLQVATSLEVGVSEK